MMRSALIGMLLVLPAAIAYSSGSTSAYASAAGKSSAYASAAGKSSTFASGKTAPTPTPTGTVAKKIHTIRSTISLAGVPASAFNPNTPAGQKVRLAFRKTIAKGMKVCGVNGNSQCSSDDVTIVSVTRRRAGAKVDFYVKTTSAANAKAGATTLETTLKKNGGADFVTSLKAAGATELEKATGVTVVKKPVAGTTTVYEKKAAIAPASVTAGVSLASLVFAALALQ